LGVFIGQKLYVNKKDVDEDAPEDEDRDEDATEDEQEDNDEDDDDDNDEDGDEDKDKKDSKDEDEHRNGEYEFLGPLKMTKGDTFALLNAFESGNMDSDPTMLREVITMSSGDSIYVASQLLVDPAEWNGFTNTSLCRILGNIGRPGIAMLISPADPMVKQRG
jgi:hypothetical protein